MTVTVCYYGLLADRRGVNQELVTSAFSTAAALYHELDAAHQLGLAITDFRVAVNDEIVPWYHHLAENDTVSLLPPMSGG